MNEFACCHGTPAVGHSATCPYDKEFFGPAGIRFGRIAGPACAVDFHAAGGSLSLAHAENSAYARNLRAQAQARAQIQPGAAVAGEARATGAGARDKGAGDA